MVEIAAFILADCPQDNAVSQFIALFIGAYKSQLRITVESDVLILFYNMLTLSELIVIKGPQAALIGSLNLFVFWSL